MVRDRGRDRDERDERDTDRGRDRGDERGRDRDVDTARREYGKIGSKLMDIYKHDQQQAKSRSGGGRDWYQLKEGWNLFRILPALDPEKPFYVLHKVHYQVGPGGDSFVYCPKTLSEDEECPICEYVELTVKEGKNKKEVAAATEMKAGGRWLCQVLDRDENDDQPMLFSFSQTIYNGVMDLVTGKYPDLLEFENGYDISIKREGTKRTNTRYPSILPEKDPTPVNPDVVDRMIDLDEYVTKRIFSAKELERILDGEDPMEVVNSRDGGSRGRDRDKGEERDRDRDREGRDRDDRHAGGGRSPYYGSERKGSRDRDRDRDLDERAGRRDRGREDQTERAETSRREERSHDRDERPSSRERDDDRSAVDRDRDRDRSDRDSHRGRDRDEGRDQGHDRGREDDDRVAAEMDRLAKESGAERGRR